MTRGDQLRDCRIKAQDLAKCYGYDLSLGQILSQVKKENRRLSKEAVRLERKYD
jgi:hypothetical protein